METRYNKEYRQYYIYALEQFLIKTYGYSEHDARIKVMQDYDEVKEDLKEKKKPDFADYLLIFMHKGLIELFNLLLL